MRYIETRVSLLPEADGVLCLSRQYYDGCMRKRNHYMVEQSAYCISALLHPRSGTGQTVAYALEQGGKW